MPEPGRELGIGLIGSGFMGRSHAIALTAAAAVFELPVGVRLEMLADAGADLAARAASSLGFARSTADWRALVEDARVDVVHIAAPNALHADMALAAIAAGKPVHCEKPLAPNTADAERLVRAAEEAGVVNAAGFNYVKNPIQGLARDLIAGGEIGEPVGFRGIHTEGYMVDPEAPYSWRHDREGGGVAMDLGSHVVSLARFLLGDIAAVNATTRTVYPTRRDGDGNLRPVEVDDQIDVLMEFASGVTGSFQASWLSAGRTMQLGYEIICTRGNLVFTQERLNELQLFRHGGPARTNGFTTIVAGPEHAPYANFCPAPGHQLGFNDLKTIEMRDFLIAIAENRPTSPDFREAARIQRVIDAALASARSRQWVDI